MSFNSSQLQSAVSEGRFEDIAPQLDAEELQVRHEQKPRNQLLAHHFLTICIKLSDASQVRIDSG